MIAIAVILLLTAAMIQSLIVFWRNIVGWIKKAVKKIKEALGLMVDGTRTFILQTAQGLKNRSKYYYKNQATREWEEVVYTKSVEESEVPPEILAKVRKTMAGTEVSTTEELKLAIGA